MTACRNPRPLANPGEVFLARAAARDRLFQSGDMDLDEAIDGLLDVLAQLRPCPCQSESYRRMMAPAPRSRRRRSS